MAAGYGLLGAGLLVWITRFYIRVSHVLATTAPPDTGSPIIPLVTIGVIAAFSILVSLSVAYLLARRTARRAVLLLAAVSCIGVPIGTLLGAITIYALTRKEVIPQFNPQA